jgi:hypothetical protein
MVRSASPDDWKTVSQNLSEKHRNRVSDLLSMEFSGAIQIKPAIIGFLESIPNPPPLTVASDSSRDAENT